MHCGRSFDRVCWLCVACAQASSDPAGPGREVRTRRASRRPTPPPPFPMQTDQVLSDLGMGRPAPIKPPKPRNSRSTQAGAGTPVPAIALTHRTGRQSEERDWACGWVVVYRDQISTTSSPLSGWHCFCFTTTLPPRHFSTLIDAKLFSLLTSSYPPLQPSRGRGVYPPSSVRQPEECPVDTQLIIIFCFYYLPSPNYA